MMVGGASGTAQRVGEGGNLYTASLVPRPRGLGTRLVHSICSDTVEKATTYHPQKW